MLGYYLLAMIGDYNRSPFVVNHRRKEVLKSIKEENNLDELCNTTNRKMVRSYLEEVLSYGYTQEPHYSKLKHLLTVELLEMKKFPNADVFGHRSNQIINRDTCLSNHSESFSENIEEGAFDSDCIIQKDR